MEREIGARMDVIPALLPLTAAQCETLSQYRVLVMGLSQEEVAAAACTNPPMAQSRISLIESGRVMPRRKKWPDLLRAYQLKNQEGEFYRMMVNARKLYMARHAMTQPISVTEPLLALARVENPQAVIGLHDVRPLSADLVHADRQRKVGGA